MPQKAITSVDITSGRYTIKASDRGKHLVFQVAAIIVLPRYDSVKKTGLQYTDDEVEITVWNDVEVSFIDDNSTADIRVVGDKGGYGAVWIMNGKILKQSSKKWMHLLI